MFMHLRYTHCYLKMQRSLVQENLNYCHNPINCHTTWYWMSQIFMSELTLDIRIEMKYIPKWHFYWRFYCSSELGQSGKRACPLFGLPITVNEENEVFLHWFEKQCLKMIFVFQSQKTCEWLVFREEFRGIVTTVLANFWAICEL